MVHWIATPMTVLRCSAPMQGSLRTKKINHAQTSHGRGFVLQRLCANLRQLNFSGARAAEDLLLHCPGAKACGGPLPTSPLCDRSLDSCDARLQLPNADSIRDVHRRLSAVQGHLQLLFFSCLSISRPAECPRPCPRLPQEHDDISFALWVRPTCNSSMRECILP